MGFSTKTRAQSVPNQGKTMSWIGFGVNKNIGEHFAIEYFQTNSIALSDSVRMNFIQPNLNIKYKLDQLSFYLGTKPTFSFGGNQLIYNRLTAGIKYKFRFNKYFRSKISFNFEQHFTQRSKFQQRYYLRWDLYYRNTDWPLRLRPFFNQKIYYYTGGRPLQYYDEFGSKTENIPPSGLHAYRWRAGIKIFPTKNMILSAFLEQQKEFNINFLGTKEINSLNPNSGKIRRGFYNYTTIGLSVYFLL